MIKGDYGHPFLCYNLVMHISDLKKYNRCHRLYQLSNENKPEYFPFYNVVIDIDKSIALKLNINDYQTGQIGDELNNTKEHLLKSNYLFKARFSYKDFRVKVPLFVLKKHNHCDLYFYALNISTKNIDYQSVNITTEVVEKNGYIVDDIYYLFLNKEYIRDEELDHQQLWQLEKLVFERERLLEKAIDNLNKKELEGPIRTSKCMGIKQCQFYYDCFPCEKDLPNNSILTLVSSSHKYEMFHSGIKYLKDADESLVEGNRVQLAQIQADKNGGTYINKPALSKWLSTNLSYPISFIDFEWDLYPIPPYQGLKPLDVLPFQYSLHILSKSGKLRHYQYIGFDDCRQELVESMLKNMPKRGSVVAYNAVGAEMIRIKELAAYLPQYQQELENINKRMVDLAYPLIEGLIYDTRLRGCFSLKDVEKMIDKEHSYSQLDCENGLQAVELHRIATLDIEKRNEIKRQLYEYCGLDTYSLYKLYQYLINQ